MTSLPSLVGLLVAGVLALALLVAIVLSAVLARGPARWLAPLGFGLMLVEQVALAALVPALGAGPFVSIVVGVVFTVPAAICLGLAVVLGYRAAVRRRGAEPYGQGSVTRPGTEPPPGF